MNQKYIYRSLLLALHPSIFATASDSVSNTGLVLLNLLSTNSAAALLLGSQHASHCGAHLPTRPHDTSSPRGSVRTLLLVITY